MCRNKYKISINLSENSFEYTEYVFLFHEIIFMNMNKRAIISNYYLSVRVNQMMNLSCCTRVNVFMIF